MATRWGTRIKSKFPAAPGLEEGSKVVSYRYHSQRATYTNNIFGRLRSDLKTFKAKRDVVDGQQRIRTILSFIDQSLLKDFVFDRDHFVISAIHNKELGGKSFEQLSKDDKQRILDYQFSVHSFPADTDDREILQIFARMNSTGVKLNAQELRNAEFFGQFKTAAYDVATEQLNRWRDWGVFTPDQIARMNEVELSSEFMIFILSGGLSKDNKIIDKYYSDYDESFSDRPEVTERFRTVFDTIERMISADDIKNLFSNRTIFFALFAIISSWHFGVMPQSKVNKKLSTAKPKRITGVMVEQLVDPLT